MKRIAIISIIIEDLAQAEEVNLLLHRYAEWIIGRMGVPMRERGISVIAIVLAAETDTVSALSGQLGRLQGVTAKAVYATK